MTLNYAYNPSIWPSVLMVLLMSALAVYSGRRRSVPGATPFMIACLFAAGWAAGSLMESAAMDFETKLFWFKVQVVCELSVVIATTCFVLEYAWPGRWLTPRNLALLSFPYLLAVLMILTDHLIHLAYAGYVFNGSVQPQYGPLSWIMLVYFIGILGVLNLIVLGWLFLHFPQHRWPVILMIIGQLLGRTLFMAERISSLHSVPSLNLLGVSFEFLMYAFVLFGFHILDPIPLARQTAIQQMHSGMLVLDPQGRVAGLNPAAERILRLPARRLVGQPIRELLPAYPEGRLDEAGETDIEFSRGAWPETQHYTLTISQLNDWRGLAIGRMLMLQDVTGQKRSQAQILEQQRALATLTERERLARELHDSLGQVLGFTSLTLGAARKMIADGKLERADDQLAHLENIVTEAHADVREYILDLRTTPTRERPFFLALQGYLDGFRQNYGIQVEVSIGPGVDDTVFTPEAQVQLFRILQEAFSNARKHAGTDCLQVSFEMEDDLVRMSIQDNGRGFDLAQTASEGHFGVRFMRERAEQLGGSLRVDSAPGEGTWVVVQIPGNLTQRRQG
jgi:signal transduction histidine kinase